MSRPRAGSPRKAHGRMKVRWRICIVLFLTWLMSYMDRSIMPMALPFVGIEFGLKPTVMGLVAGAFFLGYGSMQIPGGIIADRIGSRKTISLAMAFWSVFSILTGLAGSLAMLICVRILFGLGEGMHPPAAFKALSSWFPSSERARANGLVMASNTLGPTVAPVIFALVIAHFGWRRVFFVDAVPGLLIVMAVVWYLRDKPSEHPNITGGELSEIAPTTGKQEQKVPLSELLKYGALWQLFFVYMTWDVTWWGFQAWLPSYLERARGFTLIQTGGLTALPYAAGFVGLITSAYLSDRIGKRKIVLMAVLAGNAVFMLMTANAPDATTAVILLTCTGFFLPAIQGPFWALPMDLLPSRVMGYSTGFINTGGQIAGFCSPIVIGALIQRTGHYQAGFIFMAASASVSAFLVATLKDSRLQPAESELRASAT